MIAPVFADVREEIRSFLPSGIELYDEHLLFRLNFLHHEFHSFLCKKAKEAYEEGGEKLKYWIEVIDFLDKFSY